MKQKRFSALIALCIVLLGVGLGFSLWWFLFRGSPGPIALNYTVVLEYEITPEGTGLRVFRVVLHIASGTGLRAVRGYLSATQTAGDLYELFTTQGQFIALGEALQGDIGRIPPPIKERLAPWPESPRKVGKEGPYTIYQVRGP